MRKSERERQKEKRKVKETGREWGGGRRETDRQTNKCREREIKEEKGKERKTAMEG